MTIPIAYNCTALNAADAEKLQKNQQETIFIVSYNGCSENNLIKH